jgi:hypothetical protein
MKTKPRPGFVIFLAASALAIALPALAYQHSMSSTDIRNAYLLGNRRDSTESFFASRAPQRAIRGDHWRGNSLQPNRKTRRRSLEL